MMKMKATILPFVFCLPAVLLWLVFFYRLFNSFQTPSFPFTGWILGISFLCFTGSIAMIFVRAEEGAWRFVAAFNAVPFLMIVLFALITGM